MPSKIDADTYKYSIQWHYVTCPLQDGLGKGVLVEIPRIAVFKTDKRLATLALIMTVITCRMSHNHSYIWRSLLYLIGCP